ncbi:acyl-CoA thioesterase [Aliifodinibius salicampi]|uniref:Acyl-CoA thioesterase n=1 Tax=Fodinibius salicampi TaxID=1920655 RepID=A0ABT3PWX9_9BACT|nr:hotdog domain-containing protein [Fodinibius salicampi]MCW9712306.1 acyl-CoA thioesterase [Fodinibius salicampi]
MQFFSRKLIKPQDLNASGTLFGGTVLSWIDEEAAIFVTCQLNKGNIVTKYMTEINFVSSAGLGDIIEIGMETVSFGRTSITVRCVVRNKFSKETIIKIDKIVFVNLDDDGRPAPHNVTEPQN